MVAPRFLTTMSNGYLMASLRRGLAEWLTVLWPLFVALGCLVCARTDLCQTVTGSFKGTITDSSGALVPEATVKATNTATGVSQETISRPDGTYEIPSLNPGTYDITVTKAG